MSEIKIKSALVSVYNKDGLKPIVEMLDQLGVQILSTGGTQAYIEELGISVTAVEDLTGYPSILGGRVKTLHPKVFGGILHRRSDSSDMDEIRQHDIPPIDLIIVDLYPFEATVASGASEQEVIEKIDIGGISLIRAAAKNFKDTLIVSSQGEYEELQELLSNGGGSVSLEDRRRFATRAFNVSSHYDTAIFHYFNAGVGILAHKSSLLTNRPLRYGENPHQSGSFFGELSDLFEQLHGKELSYNNLVDIDAAISLIAEFEGQTAFAILKHTNACGVALGISVKEAYEKALQADPISAFGGILVTNQPVTFEAAEEMHSLFFEILIAPDFEDRAKDVLSQKKNRILLIQKGAVHGHTQFRSLLNGVLVQEKDELTEAESDLKVVTKKEPSAAQKEAMIFANKIVKHTKSNAIVLASKDQMVASGTGQTSRVDAVRQAIEKAKNFGFDLADVVMASDAFFPFADSIEMVMKEGVRCVIQPGGSVKDQEVIDFCDANEISMVFTGNRHFKH